MQKKLIDGEDKQIAYQIAAGFGEEELLTRFKNLRLSSNIDHFKNTVWNDLLEFTSGNMQTNLINLANLDRYGEILHQLDTQSRQQACIALFGCCLREGINYLTLPEYLRCCFAMKSRIPYVFSRRDFARALENCTNFIQPKLEDILSKFSIDQSFVAGSIWETMLDRLSAIGDKFGKLPEDRHEITRDDKSKDLERTENGVALTTQFTTTYRKIGKNILALAAAETYKGLFLHLDNRKKLLDNPAAKAFTKLTGLIFHPEELPFSIALEGNSAIFETVENLFHTVEPYSSKEIKFFRALNCVCLNQLYSNISKLASPKKKIGLTRSLPEFYSYTISKFWKHQLRVLNLEEIPADYSNPMYRKFHEQTTVEVFLEYLHTNFETNCLLFAHDLNEMARLAQELGLLEKEN